MDTGSHPDPFSEAMQQGLHRAIQLASAAVTGAQVYAYHRRSQAQAVAEHDERGRRVLNSQIRAERESGRASWAPALDPAWLREATLLQVARAWGAATPYADRSVPWYEPAAATAMRKCEERLRELHPYAMARYDRLRAEGMGPAEAMSEAAHLFARPPRARDASSGPRPMLEPGGHPEPGRTAPGDRPGTGGSGGQPLTGLVLSEQDKAAIAERQRAADLDAAADLRATHGLDERAVNLTGAHDAAATASAAAARAKRAARPWENDFPIPIHEVLAATGGQPPATQPHLSASQGAVRRPQQMGARP